MKNINFLVIVFAFTFCCNRVNAQTIELSIDNQVYVYDTIKHTIENKNNYLKNIVLKEKKCDYVNVKNSPPFDIYKKVFPLERISELATEKKSMAICLYCDSTGVILEVSFILLKGASISTIKLSEIKALEDAFKGTKLNIYGKCEDVKYYFFTISCRFNQLYQRMLEEGLY